MDAQGHYRCLSHGGSNVLSPQGFHHQGGGGSNGFHDALFSLYSPRTCAMVVIDGDGHVLLCGCSYPLGAGAKPLGVLGIHQGQRPNLVCIYSPALNQGIFIAVKRHKPLHRRMTAPGEDNPSTGHESSQAHRGPQGVKISGGVAENQIHNFLWCNSPGSG